MWLDDRSVAKKSLNSLGQKLGVEYIRLDVSCLMAVADRSRTDPGRRNLDVVREYPVPRRAQRRVDPRDRKDCPKEQKAG